FVPLLFHLTPRLPLRSTLFPYTTLFRSMRSMMAASVVDLPEPVVPVTSTRPRCSSQILLMTGGRFSSSAVRIFVGMTRRTMPTRSEEHTSELQSLAYLVCRLLLEKKKKL